MNKEQITEQLKQQLHQNGDIKLVESEINNYKDWLGQQTYKQVDTPVPFLFRLVVTIFFAIPVAIIATGHAEVEKNNPQGLSTLRVILDFGLILMVLKFKAVFI